MRTIRLPRTLPLTALLLAGCVGGQTGEITMLGACREDIGEGDLAELSGALDELGRERDLPIEWLDERFAVGETTLSLAVAERGPARLVGGEGCETPIVSAPVSVRVRSEDGAIDVELDGAAGLTAQGSVTVQARREPFDAGLGDGALHVQLTLDAELTTGSLLFSPAGGGEDGTTLALF